MNDIPSHLDGSGRIRKGRAGQGNLLQTNNTDECRYFADWRTWYIRALQNSFLRNAEHLCWRRHSSLDCFHVNM